MFTEKDILQFKSKGLSIEDIERQIVYFKKGFPFINLVDPATPGNGLHTHTENEIKELERYFENHRDEYDIIKFVPASGAASRMFKHLFEFRDKFSDTKPDLAELEQNKSYHAVHQFFKNLKSFAFYDELKALLEKESLSVDDLLNSGDHHLILDYLLSEKGLNYANLPKGLLAFHSYEKNNRLAVEEHLVESINYATDVNKKSHLHLTVSPEHLENFKKSISDKKKAYEDEFDITLHISFSLQKPSTDMIAVDMDNNPFRLEDGRLLFRPGGHGALIENLNDLDAEIVFIKNIDNIVPDHLRSTTYMYKRAIGGLLLKLQEKTFDFLDTLDDGNISEIELENMKDFAEKNLNIFIPAAYKGYDHMDRIDFLYNKLNRPIRICGMVKNEGEPGGGPYWVTNENDEISLQIVESSQMDLSNPDTGRNYWQSQRISTRLTLFVASKIIKEKNLT